MPIDGAFLRHLKRELEGIIIGSRVDKIYQPTKYEIIVNFRGMNSSNKLLISSNSNYPRVNITNYNIENPQTPPMFCMLLRKRLISSKLINIRQIGLERALYFDFETRNEMGDIVNLTLAVEIMGKYSNTILIDGNNRIIDAIKRVSADMSSKRLIIPGIKYDYPPKQDKVCILSQDISSFKLLLNEDTDLELHKFLCSKIQGISSNVFNQIIDNSINRINVKYYELSDVEKERIFSGLNHLVDTIVNVKGMPYKIYNQNKNSYDISFIKNTNSESIKYESFWNLIDEYYYEKDKLERIKVKNSNLIKTVNNLISRCRNKIKIQQKELKDCEDKDIYKVCGDIIISNIGKIRKGMQEITLSNFYKDNQEDILIKLDPTLGGIENSQAYYKKYKKACNAERILKEEILKSNRDIEYLEGVLDFLSRSESTAVIEEIKQELEDENYIKKNKSNKKIKYKTSEPDRYISSDGFKILVGKNSRQNDMLTFKVASKKDVWLHTKNIPGSHVIIVTEGKEPSDEAILYAANLCVLNSKARYSSNVPVDYTEVYNVKKPSGAKPGMVNYFNYKTLYVTPK